MISVDILMSVPMALDVLNMLWKKATAGEKAKFVVHHHDRDIVMAAVENM